MSNLRSQEGKHKYLCSTRTVSKEDSFFVCHKPILTIYNKHESPILAKSRSMQGQYWQNTSYRRHSMILCMSQANLACHRSFIRI